MTGAEIQRNDKIIGKVMLHDGRVKIITNQSDLRQSLEDGVVGRDRKLYTPEDGIDFIRAVVHQFSGAYVRALPIHDKRLRTNARRETKLHRVADSFTPKLEVAIRLAFSLGRRAMKRDSRSPDNAVYALHAMRESLKDTLPKLLRKVYIAGGETGAAMLKIAAERKEPLTFTFGRSAPRSKAQEKAIDWADRHAAELIDGITETSREQINNAIAEQLESGEKAFDEILDAVGSPERAELIARTETMTAIHEGQRAAWRQAVEEGSLPEDSRRTWIATGDEGTCPICEELDGKRADLDGEYPGGYGGPPAHPRCRCTEGLT